MPPRSKADTETKTEVANHLSFTVSRRSNAGDVTETKTKTARVDNLNGVCIYPYLPQDIIFEVLLYLPAQVIHDLMRRVCDEWKLMLSTKAFIYNHLRNSTPGIIIMAADGPLRQFYVEMRRGHLEICRFDLMDSYLCGSSVNGLLLAGTSWNEGESGTLSIVNPLTKQREVVDYDIPYACRTTIAVDEASMKYKAVRSFDHKARECVSVLTIGVDNDWRYIDMKHISEPGREALIGFPLATRGYVHWMGYYSVLTLNVETEIIYEFPMIKERSPYAPPLTMDRNLSCCYLSKERRSGEYLMEVFEMNSETGEWTKLLSSDLKPLSDRFKGLKSIQVFGVLGGGEVFLFGSDRLCAAYNVRTREIQSFEYEKKAHRYCSGAHMNSMIWYK